MFENIQLQVAVRIQQIEREIAVAQRFSVYREGAVVFRLRTDGDRSCERTCTLRQFVYSACLICRNGNGIGRSPLNQRKIIDQITVFCRTVCERKVDSGTFISRHYSPGFNLQTSAVSTAAGDVHGAIEIHRGAIRYAAIFDIQISSFSVSEVMATASDRGVICDTGG